ALSRRAPREYSGEVDHFGQVRHAPERRADVCGHGRHRRQGPLLAPRHICSISLSDGGFARRGSLCPPVFAPHYRGCVPLRSRRKASPFWIILLLISARTIPPRSEGRLGRLESCHWRDGSNSTHRGSNPLSPASHSGLSLEISGAHGSG